MQFQVAGFGIQSTEGVQMSETDNGQLLVPALKAGMGDWAYYISFLPMSEIASRISVVEDIHTTKSLKEQLQRALTKNADKISEYLQSQPQRFFNSIVVGTYGGDPKWHEISVRTKIFDVPPSFKGALGFLELTGTETLFAIDGQHRVVGIKKALKSKKKLATEEVAVIFVRGVSATKRTKDPKGFERTRRLFSTLNRYAKPVQKRDIIALDEDDVIAIVTRRLLEEHSLLIDKIAMTKTKPVPPTNARELTSLVALYDALDVFLRDRVKGWKDFKRSRPPERVVDEFAEEAMKILDQLCRSFPELKELRGSAPDDEVAGRYRGHHGGHLLFRPVGFELVFRVVKELHEEGFTLQNAVRAVAKAPMELSENPWRGLLWDDVNERMLTAPENKKVAARLLHCAVGGDLSARRYTKAELREELAGLLKRDVSRVKLPSYATK